MCRHKISNKLKGSPWEISRQISSSAAYAICLSVSALSSEFSYLSEYNHETMFAFISNLHAFLTSAKNILNLFRQKRTNITAMKYVFVHTDPPDGTIQVLDTSVSTGCTGCTRKKVLAFLVKVLYLLSAFQNVPKMYPWR
jgi:hypothetical protein